MADWSSCVYDDLFLSHLLDMLLLLPHELVVPPEGLLAVCELDVDGQAVLLEEGHALLGLGELVRVDVDDLVGQFVSVLPQGVQFVAHGVDDLLEVRHFLLPGQGLGLQLLQLPAEVLHLIHGLVVGGEVGEEDQHDESQQHLDLIPLLASSLRFHLLQPLLKILQVLIRPFPSLLLLRHVTLALDYLRRALIISLLHTFSLHDYIQIVKQQITTQPSNSLAGYKNVWRDASNQQQEGCLFIQWSSSRRPNLRRK